MSEQPDRAEVPPSVVGDDLGLGLRVPGQPTIDAVGRRRLHPVSPVIHGVASIPIGIGLVVVLAGIGVDRVGAWSVPAAIGVVALLAVAVAAWSFLAWRATWYWFDEDGDLRVDSGVVTRQQRRLQLSRLQAVNVAQPLFARVFSMAEVTVEVAGTQDSRVTMRYVTLEEARALRNEILARSAGLAGEAGEAPERVIVRVPPGDLAWSLLIRSSTAALLLLSLLILVVTFLSEGWGGLALALITGGVPILIVVSEFIRYFGFTVSESPDGLRLRFGLAKTEARTVPPGRVQAIEFVEPLLWRRRGWVRLRVNIAGVGHEDSNGGREETLLLPVATRAVATDVVHRVLPGLELDAITWWSAPRRSRRRAPIQWRRLAVGWDDAVFAARSGRITRRLAVMPHARVQSVRLTQGPWERPLRLASIHLDSTPGPVTVAGRHLDAVFAREVADAQAERSRLGRADDHSIRWAAPDDGS